MSGPKKVYVYLCDLVHLMIVPECFTRDAAGYKEQLYPQSVLIRLHDTNRIAIADPQARLVKWDGNEMPSRFDPHAIAQSVLEAAALEVHNEWVKHKGMNCTHVCATIRALANNDAELAEIVKGPPNDHT